MVKTPQRKAPSGGIIHLFFVIAGCFGIIAVLLLIFSLISGFEDNKHSTSYSGAKKPNLIKATPLPTITYTSTQTHTPTPEASQTPTMTQTPTIHPWIEEYIRSMSPQELVGQILMVGIDGQKPGDISCSYLLNLIPGGVVYRSENVINPEQLRQLSIAIQSCLSGSNSPSFLIAVDHEGQYINRFDNGVNFFPSAMAIAASNDPKIAYDVAYAQGLELSYSGVNTVLGPVADVLTDLDNVVISLRSYGGDAQQVANFVSQAVLGYQNAGIAPVLKHFPGHGGVSSDSHTTLPIDYSDLSTLKTINLPPFRFGIEAGAQIIMTAHVAFPAIDPSGAPATLSSPIINLLREELDYDGVILTDSMGMGAITGSGQDIPNASLKAVQSGVDMLLITSTDIAIQTKNLLLTALENGELSREKIEDSVRRILLVKYKLGLDTAPQLATSPDLESGKEIAFNAGYHAPAVIKDTGNLIPLPPDKSNLLAIVPPDAWGLDYLLSSNLEQQGFLVSIAHYDAPWNGSIANQVLLADFIDRASRYDLTLLFTWEAHLNRLRYGDTWQTEIANRLIDNGTRVVIVALKSPTDLLEFPRAPVYLATFGTTPGQLQALGEILTGGIEPLGHCPLNIPVDE